MHMRPANRLAEETSPYLLQHAHNPVDWYPWGPEALARAREEKRPILLSVGYSACHWCHVMERESFEDDAIAALMNEHFVCIKVDREERPDLDAIYMQATVAMNGAGGWPMTVFLTPDDHRPFFAGTYFPPKDRYGRPGFPTVLRRLAELWRSERETLEEQASLLAEEVRAGARATHPGALDRDAVDAAQLQLGAAFDADAGGFGRSPKFPPSGALRLLLRHHRRAADATSRTMVTATLDGMAQGGMRDHLGGGFARYSTDDRWLVPHFEKMLYDNAQLARVYAEAFQCWGRAADEAVVRDVCTWVLREMTSADGAFYSSTDADSEGEEGKYFVWTVDEVEAVLPAPTARAFCAYYDVTAPGNWEGTNVLHTPRRLEEVAADLDVEPGALKTTLAAAAEKMRRARADRVPPATDDKILCAWNALMIGALAFCGRVFDEATWRGAAARAADFVLARMRRPDGGLHRTSRGGKTHLDAYLEDYAFLCDALIDVYEAGEGIRFLDAATHLADRMIDDFGGEGAFFGTAEGHEELLVRPREGQDGAIPSANAVAARALLRLSWHLDRDDLRRRAETAIEAWGQLVARAPRAFCSTLEVVEMLAEGPVEIVLTGEPDDPRTAALARALGRCFAPSAIVVWADGESRAAEGLLRGKGLVDGAPAAFVCRDHACRAPITDPGEVAAEVSG